jgi:16S rRNA (uracil1498-N3)-methyltransferase
VSAPVFVAALGDAHAGGVVVVDGPEGRHGADVVRMRPGEPVDLVDGHGTRASGVVVDVGRARFDVRVGAVAIEPEPAPRLVVAQALPKGDRSELAVEQLTEVGVDEIVPWEAQRCVGRWRADRTPRRWADAARSAAKQSRRARFPVVADLHSALALTRRVATAARALVLHEAADTDLAALTMPTAGEIVLIVGPEGGLSDDELSTLASAGATPVRLGPTVLRTSSAGMVASALVLAAAGRWTRAGGPAVMGG